MSKKVFKNKMNGLSDDELMHVLENSNKYQKDAIDAVIDIAKSRGLEISKFQQEIEKERVEEKEVEKKLDKKYEQNILKFVPKIIGVYQILGGLFLFLMSIFLSDFRMVAWAQVFLVLLVFFSIVGGYLFLKQKKYGAFLCVINQSLQIIRFQFLGFTLKYYTGISAGVIIESSFLNELSFSFNLTPGASFILGPIYTMNDFFGLNVIPILFIYYIYRHKEILTKM